MPRKDGHGVAALRARLRRPRKAIVALLARPLVCRGTAAAPLAGATATAVILMAAVGCANEPAVANPRLAETVQPNPTPQSASPRMPSPAVTATLFPRSASNVTPPSDVIVTTAVEVVTCESGIAVPSPTTNVELVEDCESLLKAEDRLAGAATLNWSAGRAITDWEGVTVAGMPPRVTKLELAGSNLAGELQPQLGDLAGLTELRLNNNSLTGPIPSTLGQLTSITHAYLGGNDFDGCIPAALWAVPNNDFDTLAIAYCQPSASRLIVVSDGAADTLLLEWGGGASTATKWQYRTTYWNQSEWRQEPWGAWTDIPSSDASTRSYRATGLRSYTGYFFELRAIVGPLEGLPSNIATGATQYSDSRLPEMDPNQIVEGDGTQQWRIGGLSYVITIPSGMRLKAGGGTLSSDGIFRVALFHLASDSWISLNADTGEVLERHIAPEVSQTVGPLFDQLIASIQEVSR